MAFHIDSDGFAPGEVNHLTSWFGETVELDGHFLDPAQIVAEVESAGLVVMAVLERQPCAAGEYPSRRCYLLGRRPPTLIPVEFQTRHAAQTSAAVPCGSQGAAMREGSG